MQINNVFYYKNTKKNAHILRYMRFFAGFVCVLFRICNGHPDPDRHDKDHKRQRQLHYR